MSLILNQGIASFEFGAIAYLLVSFVVFAYRRSGIKTPTPALTSITPTPVAATPKPEPIAAISTISHTAALSAPVTSTVIKEQRHTPPRQAQASSRKLRPIEVLRQQCQAAGIPWRNAHGKGKHLTSHEMKQRLGHA